MIRARKLTAFPPVLLLAAPLAVALSVGASSAVAEDPVRLTDLRPGGESGVANLDAAVFAGKLYFAATATGADLDLWVYDGVSAPSMVTGGGQLQPEELMVWQGALYFEAGPFTDRELWRYDGVNPPVEALDLLPGGSGQPTNLAAVGPEICFGAFTNTIDGDQLVCWDGATAPDVHELREGGGAGPEAMTVLGSTLYFNAYADEVGSEPFAYQNFSPPDLVADLVSGIGSSNPESFAQVGASVYFRASGRAWSYDGVLPPAIVSSTFVMHGGLAAWGDRLLAGGYLDEELDAPSGAYPQLHIRRDSGFVALPWDGGSVPASGPFLHHREAIYFRASPSVTASDLFRYCGGGLVERVTDQFADVSYISSPPIVFQGRIYFSAYEAATGHELWVLDPFTATFCDGFEEGNDDAWSAAAP